MSRYLGIDHGIRRIGLALSDPTGITSRPVEIIHRTTVEAELERIAEIIEQEEVVRVIVGLPTDSEGQPSEQAKTAIRWSRKLAEKLAVPIVFWDESYSSEEAEEIVRRQKRNKRNRGRKFLDDIAASLILQDYLDAVGGNYEPGKTLQAFSDIE